MKTPDELNHISGIVLDAAIAVHREMGSGLLEAVYHHCLLEELSHRSIEFKTQMKVPLVYRGVDLNKDYCIDILIENEIILELKAVEGILPVHESQLLSYLKLSGRRLGLLINFNVVLLKNGIKRMVNKL